MQIVVLSQIRPKQDCLLKRFYFSVEMCFEKPTYYDNISVQVNANFHGSMKDIFQMKIGKIYFSYLWPDRRFWVLVRAASMRRH